MTKKLNGGSEMNKKTIGGSAMNNKQLTFSANLGTFTEETDSFGGTTLSVKGIVPEVGWNLNVVFVTFVRDALFQLRNQDKTLGVYPGKYGSLENWLDVLWNIETDFAVVCQAMAKDDQFGLTDEILSRFEHGMKGFTEVFPYLGN